jgi:hypothetical protein
MKVVNKVRGTDCESVLIDSIQYDLTPFRCNANFGNQEMSTFIMALGQIFRDLVYFMIVLVVVILMFSDVRTRMTLRDCSASYLVATT